MNVIFDMDGLMFDTEKVFIKAWDYAGERIGIGKAGYMVYKTLGMSIVASYEIWNEEFGDRYNQEELRKYTKEFLKNYYESLFITRVFSLRRARDVGTENRLFQSRHRSHRRQRVANGQEHYSVRFSRPALR